MTAVLIFFCNPNKCKKFAGVLTGGQGGGILPGISVHSRLAADAPSRGGQLPGVRVPHALVRPSRAVQTLHELPGAVHVPV